MMMVEDMITSGDITYVMLALLAAEAVIYIFFVKPMRPLLSTLASGACLVFALRTALLTHNATEIAAWLSLGFVFHLLEVWAWAKMSKHQPQ